MIEAEWWDYDSLDEMADAVAGDIGFIVESALDARGSCLLALPGGRTPLPVFEKLAKAPRLEESHHHPDGRPEVPNGRRRSNVRAIRMRPARRLPRRADATDIGLSSRNAPRSAEDLPLPRTPG